MNKNIRIAKNKDTVRIAEIQVFNFRLYFYPFFKNDIYYFKDLQVPTVAREYENFISNIFVYDFIPIIRF